MSVWTHVNGSIRYDLLPDLSPEPDLGKTCRFEDEESVWDACDVPCGSEGSLKHYMWRNPSQDSMAARTAMFWGDLRDYEEDKHSEIVEYFNRITKDHDIRQGVFEIRCGGIHKIYGYDFHKEEWNLVHESIWEWRHDETR